MVGLTRISSRSIAWRQSTRTGMTTLWIFDAEWPSLTSRSTSACRSDRRSAVTAQVCLVAADHSRLVGRPGAGKDRPSLRSLEPRLSRLGERLSGRCLHRPLADGAAGVVAPALRGRERTLAH